MFIAGPYTSTRGGNDLGITQRGYELEETTFEERVDGDCGGESMLDGVYLGADVFFNVVFQEYNLSGVQAAFWPFGTLGKTGQAGRMKSDLASSLVLTVVAGTRAALQGPATVTATKSILPGNFNVRKLFAARLRNVPMRLQCLPNLENYPGYGQLTHYVMA